MDPPLTSSQLLTGICWDQLAKIRQHEYKERLRVSKSTKFEHDLMKANEDIAPQSRRILQTFCGLCGGEGGGYRQVCGPHSPKFRDVVKQCLRSHLTYHQFWQAS